MDATYDYEVWNQPVAGLFVMILPPHQTMRLATKLSTATISRAKVHPDPRFHKYRSAEAASFVESIIMEVNLKSWRPMQHRWSWR